MATASIIEAKRRGFWLRVARERANLTQEAVAQELGLSSRSKSTMSAWETGSRDPKLRYLNAMARLYGVPVSVFMEPDPTAEESLEERLAKLARAAIRLAHEDRPPEGRAAQAPGDGRVGSRDRRRA
jgi:transcriptional regulator with XRE-family HTH domain